MSLNELIDQRTKTYLNIRANNLTYDGSLTPNPLGNKVINVTTKSDFGSEVAGFITLTADTSYLVQGDVNLDTTRLNMNDGSLIFGFNIDSDVLRYSGSDFMLNSTDFDVNIQNLCLSAPNGGVLVFVDTVPKTHRVIMRSVQITNNVKGFDITDALLSAFIEGIFFRDTNNCFLFKGTPGDFVLTDAIVPNISGTFIDLGTSVLDVILISRCLLHVTAGQTLLSGLVSSANLSANGTGIVANNQFLETGTILNNISPSDIRWSFMGNGDQQAILRDSRVFGSNAFENNALVTTITVTNQWESINAIFIGSFNERFSSASSGILTALNVQRRKITAIARGDIRTASGNDNIEISIFKNGSKIADISSFLEVKSSAPLHVSVAAPTECIDTDTFEIKVRNITGTNDLVVRNCQFTII